MSTYGAPTGGGPTVGFASPLIANVAEPGDIALYVVAVAAILVVGLALLGVDTVVKRLGEWRRRRAENADARPDHHRKD